MWQNFGQIWKMSLSFEVFAFVKQKQLLFFRFDKTLLMLLKLLGMKTCFFCKLDDKKTKPKKVAFLCVFVSTDVTFLPKKTVAHACWFTFFVFFCVHFLKSNGKKNEKTKKESINSRTEYPLVANLWKFLFPAEIWPFEQFWHFGAFFTNFDFGSGRKAENSGVLSEIFSGWKNIYFLPGNQKSARNFYFRPKFGYLKNL